MKYVLIDTANLFFRARHGAFRAADTWEKVGFALHVTLMAANKMARRFEADHVVFALEGRSWRKDTYKPYKNNRAVARAALTDAEQEEDKMFWETYDALTKYLSERTNCSVIRCPTAEGDDIIARWIALHPQDQHVVISSDTDFVQLLATNVTQYNGITDELHTVEGIFDAKGRPVIDKKPNRPKLSQIRNGSCLKSACVAMRLTMCLVHILECAQKAQKTKWDFKKPTPIEKNKATTGTT
jgi:5'-3' exonuclease